jgi:hypothetical protein
MVRRSDRWGNSESGVLGELQLWINGKCVIHAKGLIFREDETSHIKGMHFQTFFGGARMLLLFVVWQMITSFSYYHRSGHESDWASPKDQRAWFSDVSGAVIR